MKHYDVIVIGLGVMGGAAAYHCAKRGAKVLGLDANAPGHELGSSHGSTRAIREAYFESPDYVPLIQRSYELWHQLEKETNQQLLSISGAIYLGPPGNKLTPGIAAAAIAHNLSYEQLSRKQLTQRFPGFAVPERWEAVFEQRAGVLQTEACKSAHIQLAKANGADIQFDTPATIWQWQNGKIIVDTPSQQVTANKLILTLGPWACDAFAELGIPFTGRRIVMVHLEPKDKNLFSDKNMSVYFWATPDGVFVGFPYFDRDGIRVCRHDTGDACTPSSAQREITQQDVDQITRFANKYMPDAHKSVREANIGLYTMTPDNHFVIDQHPTIPGITFAGGFSGHGFKFAPVVGEILADLSIEGDTAHPIDFLSAGRFHNQRMAQSQ